MLGCSKNSCWASCWRAFLLAGALVLTANLVSSQKACPPGCSTYGTCNLELGRCDCPWNRTGPACLDFHQGFCVSRKDVDNPVNTCVEGDPSLCVNGCNKRGRCMGGFCHCDEGYFGTDCSLSYGSSGQVEVLAGLGYRPATRGPKIYVYELPPEYHVKRDIHKVDRPPLHLAIMERLLSAGHRTADGDAADFYYLPVSSRDLKKAFLLLPALHYVAQTWPWWNRTQGRRHIIPMEGDVGTCELPLRVRLMTDKVTWLQFWGMYDFHPSWEQTFHNKIPCFVPGRDIVVPFMAMSSHDRFVIETPLRPGNAVRPRNITFFFAGGICGSGRYHALPPNCTHYKQMRYSGGVRQLVYEKFHGRPGWRVVPRTDDYARDYASAKFCLAAAGGGWGKRGIVSAMYGCVPVVATDFLYEAFEPEMDWDYFGVRVAQRDIPRLAELLEGMGEEAVREKQRRVACAAQHFHWSSSLGGIMGETGEFDAFATIMAILRMRVKYPQLKPQEYFDADQDFRDFVNCRSPPAPSVGSGSARIGGGSSGVHARSAGSSSSSQQEQAQQQPPRHPALCTMYVGPGMEYHGFFDACPPAKYYMRRKMGPPGGVLCINSSSMAACRRFDL